MGAMKRLLLLAVLAVAATAIPAHASAAGPCRNDIYDDWYQDGKIASTYPISCYRDALRHIPGGDSVYTSLEDDIRAALQAAIARGRGETVAPEVGHGFPKASPVKSRRPMMDERTHPLASATTTLAAATGSSTGSGGGGVPLPLFVLGGVALVLVVSGGIGLAVRANRGSGPAV